MARFLPFAALLALAAPAAGQDTCRLCYSSEPSRPGERPLTLEINADLSIGKLAMAGEGSGSAELDAQTGAKRTSGALIDLGGAAIQGHGRITGEPLRGVRVDLPGRVAMTAPDGSPAELTDFTSSLPANPVLDGNGVLEFTFGARLVVKGRKGGNYRGRIPISVDYN